MRKHSFILSVLLLTFAASNISGQQKGYYRYPAIHGDDIVFTAEGDLWKFNLNSRESVRLTTNLGLESYARFSDDGKWIAFVGQYEGPSEVYVMPVTGGKPKRLTFEEGSPILSQWTNDGKILYSTNCYSTLPNPELVSLNPQDLSTKLVPLSQADQGTYSADGILFFTRLRDQGSHTKRYKGGSAQTIWKFDGIHEATSLTSDYTGTSKNPMFYNNRIYFLSDRDGTMNIWSMNMNGTDLKQHTKSVKFDLADASLGSGKIVCQRGADIILYDIINDKTETPDINIVSDFDQKRIQWINDPKSRITSIDLSYKGDQVAITSRGRVFNIPVEGGRWAEVTRKYGIRYKNASYLNQKNDLAMLSDESGEFEVWKTDSYGFTAPTQVTTGSKDYIVTFLASPDANYIVFYEKDYRLKLYSKATGLTTLIAQNNYGFQTPFAWSPDSKWLAFTDRAENQNGFIRLYEVKTGKSFQVTSDRQDSYCPNFSQDGKWLYFISDRTFSTVVNSPWGNRQPEPYYDKTGKIYALALVRDAIFPFSEPNELDNLKTDSTKTQSDKDKTKKTLQEIAYDLVDLSGRLFMVPVKAGNIDNFEMNDKWIYWLETNLSDYSRSLNALKISNAKNNEVANIASGINEFKLSGDSKKLIIRDRNGLMVLNADGSKPDAKKNLVDISKWAFTIDPVEDWKQMYRDAWRMERDYFYDKNMHGVNWQEVYEQYLPLLDRITDRYELDDILAQMISELSALHMFVYGGDKRVAADNVQNGYLGADVSRDESKGGYEITHIYKTDPDYPAEQSPLAQPGTKINEGDIITEINGIKTLDFRQINEMLINKSNLQVRLRLKNAKGEFYEEVIKPVSAGTFSTLRYNEWEYTRRLEVEKASENKIGYLHLKAMSGSDFDDFVKNFYPAIGKQGLIIDVRHNRGGNIDSWVLEKLMRKAWFYWAPRVGNPYPNMQSAFTGHLVVIMDEKTASDGEAFSEGFRRLGLGKLIGKRTWGGEIWLSSSNRLVDNGIATAAENGVYSPQGEWLIEGWGVEPDIEADNPPFESFKGKDNQLEKAVQYLLNLIKEKPVAPPPIPKYPVKAFDYKNN